MKFNMHPLTLACISTLLASVAHAESYTLLEVPGSMTANYINNNAEVIYRHSNSGWGMSWNLSTGSFASLPTESLEEVYQDGITYFSVTKTGVIDLNDNGYYVGGQERYSNYEQNYDNMPVLGKTNTSAPIASTLGTSIPVVPNVSSCGESCYTSTFNGLNNNNQVVGSTDVNGRSIAFVADPYIYGSNPGGVRYLTPQLFTASEANGINDAGVVVGRAVGLGVYGNELHATLWDTNGKVFDLGIMTSTQGLVQDGWNLVGGSSVALAINNSGMVIGNYHNSFRKAASATSLSGSFVWKDGVMQDLGWTDLGGALAINNSGIVVGTDLDGGFLWKNGVGKVQLDALVGLSADSHIVTASDINDQGQIVGTLIKADGSYVGYVLNPLGVGLAPMNPILQSSTTSNTFNFMPGQNFIEVLGRSRVGGWYDPKVAVGYTFEMQAGENAFTAVQVPFQYGDGVFDLWLFDEVSAAYVLSDVQLAAGEWYEFGESGVKKFRIMGIETSAYIDPNDPNGFVTGLTFLSSDTGFSMTPMEVDVDATNPLSEVQAAAVPEPEAYAMMLAGLGLVGYATRRRRSNTLQP